MRGKKAVVYYVFMVLVVIIILIKAYLVLSEKTDQLPDYAIGEQQYSLVKMFQSGEDTLQDISWAAKDSVKQAIIRLAKDGGKHIIRETEGFTGDSCGVYAGFEVWNEDCFPDYRASFEDAFNKEIHDTLGHYGLTVGDFELAVVQRRDFIEISGEAEKGISISRGVRSKETTTTIPVITGEGLLIDPTLYGVRYKDADAVNGMNCVVRDKKLCNYLEENEFKNLYYLNDPGTYGVEFISSPWDASLGNAMTAEFGEVLLQIAAAWKADQCGDEDCPAAIGISAIATRKHSQKSQHGLGNAADIVYCSGDDGSPHYAKVGHDATFDACYGIIKDIMSQKGTYIYQHDCYVLTSKCSSDYYDSHKTHVHIHIT